MGELVHTFLFAVTRGFFVDVWLTQSSREPLNPVALCWSWSITQRPWDSSGIPEWWTMELLGKKPSYSCGQLHAECVQRVKASFKLQSQRAGITIYQSLGLLIVKNGFRRNMRECCSLPDRFVKSTFSCKQKRHKCIFITLGDLFLTASKTCPGTISTSILEKAISSRRCPGKQKTEAVHRACEIHLHLLLECFPSAKNNGVFYNLIIGKSVHPPPGWAASLPCCLIAGFSDGDIHHV